MTELVHEALSIDSLKSQLFWSDDFEGDSIKDKWVSSGGVGGSAAVVDGETGGVCRITTDGDANDDYNIYWSDLRSLLVSKRLTVEYRVKLSRTTNQHVLLGLRYDDNDRFYFNFDTVTGDTNWMLNARDGGSVTGDQDSGIAPDTDPHIFRFVCHTHGSNHIHFFIDNVECGNSPITTDITSEHLQPRLWIRTTENSEDSMDIDYVGVRQDR
jgi:hypothetical protein